MTVVGKVARKEEKDRSSYSGRHGNLGERESSVVKVVREVGMK